MTIHVTLKTGSFPDANELICFLGTFSVQVAKVGQAAKKDTKIKVTVPQIGCKLTTTSLHDLKPNI